MKIIGGQSLTLDTRSMLPVASGTCDGGDCDRRAVTFAYCSTGYAQGRDGLIPVCRRHLLVYRIGKGGTGLWQAEDEFAELRFARRSRWRWLAQWRILLDQRAAVAGRESCGQRRLRLARDVEIRADEDEFAPGECDGSGTCSAPAHIHGCFRPHRSDECDSPDEYGHIDVEIRCDYCGDALPSVPSRAHIPTTPDLQRLGFDANKVVCPDCVARVRSADVEVGGRS